jgi:hypothetical protein
MSMFSKLKQFKDLREQAKKIQNALGDVTVEGSAAWGKVKVKMTAGQEVQSVSIDPELLGAGNQAKVESAVKDAVNDAVKKAQREMANTMKKTGGLNLPGLS